MITKFKPYINERKTDLYKNNDLIMNPLEFTPEFSKLQQDIDI